MTAVASELGRDGRIIGVVGLAHCGSHFFHVVLPPLFPLLLVPFDVTYTELGLLMTVFFAASGLCQTPAGFLVDRVGAARVLIAGLTALGVGALLASMAPSYWVLLLTALVMGVGNSVFHPADYAILTHHVSSRRMGRAYGIHTVGGSIGWALAPVTMVGVASFSDWRTALLTAGVIGLVIAALVFTERHQIETPQRTGHASGATTRSASLFLTAPILGCFAFFALISVAFTGLQGFMPLGLNQQHGIPLVAATTTVTAYMLGMVAGTLGGGVAADRTERHQGIIAIGLLASAAIILLVGLVAVPVPLILAAIALAGACAGFTVPSRDMLVRSSTPRGSTGKVFGFVYSGLDLGATVAPAFLGWLLDHGLPGGVFILIAAATACSVLTAVAIRRPEPVPVGASS